MEWMIWLLLASWFGSAQLLVLPTPRVHVWLAPCRAPSCTPHVARRRGSIYRGRKNYVCGPAPLESSAPRVEAPREAPRHMVQVGPLPTWLDHERLLGPQCKWQMAEDADCKVVASGSLTRHEACALAARIRGLGFGGEKLELVATPPLPRTAVRAARTEEARSRRQTSPGFSRKGVKLDDEGKFSLTPERLAQQLAKRVSGQRVVDATCGAGGNTIAFAQAGCQVIAIERDKPRLQLARHNSRIYGLPKQLSFPSCLLFNRRFRASTTRLSPLHLFLSRRPATWLFQVDALTIMCVCVLVCACVHVGGCRCRRPHPIHAR